MRKPTVFLMFLVVFLLSPWSPALAAASTNTVGPADGARVPTGLLKNL